jgi:hypothetical protein
MPDGTTVQVPSVRALGMGMPTGAMQHRNARQSDRDGRCNERYGASG